MHLLDMTVFQSQPGFREAARPYPGTALATGLQDVGIKQVHVSHLRETALQGRA